MCIIKRICIVLFILTSQHTISQTLNDYRSANDGNWTNANTWEVFDGSTWVLATNFPGEVSGTNNVFVLGNNTITLNSGATGIPNSINSLTVGPGQILVSADSTLNTPLITLVTGGVMEWISNNTDLALPANATIIVNGGDLSENNPCNANKTITIGATVYASCNNGGNSIDIDFGDINMGGGTLGVFPSSNGPICVGETLNLLSNPNGTGSNETGTSFLWSAIGPGGYTFNSTLQNPVINTAAFTAGSYTYTVTITDPNSNTNTNSVNITIGSAPNAPTSNGNQQICSGNSIPTLSATVGTGVTIDWYDSNSGGSLLLANSLTYTPTSQGSFFVEARDITTNCGSSTRTEVVLTISSCRVITNRRITFRVRN